MSSLRVVVASRLPWATYVFYICMLTTEIKISWVGRSTRWVLEASAFLPKINSCCFDFGDSNDSHTGSDSLVLPGLSVPTSVSSPDPPQFPDAFLCPPLVGSRPAAGRGMREERDAGGCSDSDICNNICCNHRGGIFRWSLTFALVCKMNFYKMCRIARLYLWSKQ